MTSRQERRYQSEKMKRRAANLWSRWHPIFRRRPVSAHDLQRRIGTMAATHNTHQCVMCRFEKLHSIPTIRERRANLYARDLAIENEQEHTAEYLGRLSSMAEECDEMREAFGHDIHRSLLMTAYEQSLVQGERLRDAGGNG